MLEHAQCTSLRIKQTYQMIVKWCPKYVVQTLEGQQVYSDNTVNGQ